MARYSWEKGEHSGKAILILILIIVAFIFLAIVQAKSAGFQFEPYIGSIGTKIDCYLGTAARGTRC